jgi:hypothetical protein
VALVRLDESAATVVARLLLGGLEMAAARSGGAGLSSFSVCRSYGLLLACLVWSGSWQPVAVQGILVRVTISSDCLTQPEHLSLLLAEKSPTPAPSHGTEATRYGSTSLSRTLSSARDNAGLLRWIIRWQFAHKTVTSSTPVCSSSVHSSSGRSERGSR